MVITQITVSTITHNYRQGKDNGEMNSWSTVDDDITDVDDDDVIIMNMHVIHKFLSTMSKQSNTSKRTSSSSLTPTSRYVYRVYCREYHQITVYPLK